MATIVLVASFSLCAAAHDFWIEPSAYSCDVAAPLKAALRVGMEFNGEPVVRDENRFERFAWIDPAGKCKPVLGVEGKDPAGYVRPAVAGLHWIVYRSKPKPIELPADQFEAYLREEGLEHVIEERKTRNEGDKPGKEIYSRCAKALVAVGNDADKGFDAVAGLTLELTPERNPREWTSGGEMPFRLLFEGKPIEGIMIRARAKDDPKHAVMARTNKDGGVSLKLGHAGVWLVNAVYMHAAPPDSGADWESVWASLTLSVGSAAEAEGKTATSQSTSAPAKSNQK